MSETIVPPAPPRIGLRIVVPALSAAVFVAVYIVAVLTARGQSLEDRALGAAASPPSTPALLGAVSVPNLLLATGVLVLVALIRRRKDLALQAAIVLVVSNTAAQVLKYGILIRPQLGDLVQKNTFPSGHTTAYVSVMFTAILVAPPVIRGLVSVVGAVACSIVAIELLEFGWHRLSDVVGAVALVVTVATLAVSIFPWRARRARAPVFARLSVRFLGIGVALGLAVAVCALGAAWIVRTHTDRLMLVSTLGFAAAAVIAAFVLFTVFLFAIAQPRRRVAVNLPARVV
jgi:hypothetical protein